MEDRRKRYVQIYILGYLCPKPTLTAREKRRRLLSSHFFPWALSSPLHEAGRQFSSSALDSLGGFEEGLLYGFEEGLFYGFEEG
ncbi:hypothetical protein, partial [Staphylococcus aureus]|uniref:hypothetical protein n=1 Tax=Staphylococcus aureus TaxID=1280 RepID=UPI0038B355C9